TDINDNGFSATIEQLNQQIQQCNLPTKWKFPIDKQEEFPEAADFLYRTFLVETIPEFVFTILSFPLPGWDIFDNNNSADTVMMEIPKLNNGATLTVPKQDQTNIIYE
ncbi:45626_t:CDS:1, partial [Gigaspora margarita]